MINVSDAYNTAIDADSRHIIPRVLVYFSETATEFNGDDIISLHLLEEAKAETGNPLGAVSANELTITFDNTNHDFTPTNTESPYYGLLKPNVKIEAFLLIETAADIYEEIPLGEFYTAEWVEATVTGYDILYTVGDTDLPMIPVMEDTTVGAMFAALFAASGITNYSIDPTLTQDIELGWLPKGKVRQAIQYLCVTGNCFVNVDRSGKTKAFKNAISGTPVATLTDDNQIITAQNPQKYLGIYNVVKITYAAPSLMERQEILNLEDIEIPAAGEVMDPADFNEAPIGRVEKVRLKGADNSAITEMEYDAWSLILTVSNTGDDEEVTIKATGYPISINERSKEVEDSALVAEWGRKELSIENRLIQNGRIAKDYIDALLVLAKDPFSKFNLEVYGNPALEIGDIIAVLDPTDKIPLTNIVIERITLDYDGALSGTMDGRKLVE